MFLWAIISSYSGVSRADDPILFLNENMPGSYGVDFSAICALIISIFYFTYSILCICDKTSLVSSASAWESDVMVDRDRFWGRYWAVTCLLCV